MYDIVKIISEAVECNASDIFITVGLPPVFKIDGKLIKRGDVILKQNDTEGIIKSLIRDDLIKNELEASGERDFSYSIPQMGRFRVNAYMQRGSYAAAIRVIKWGLPDPKQLLIPDNVLNFYKKTNGLILLTGPAGSGKTTTLATIIDLINTKRSCHIITLEDPIEYLHFHKKSIVEQREIGSDTRTFATALRAALRQSPDVILVGEMRDLETISIALTAAETGHLVLSSLHTIGASKTIDRIIDVFPPAQQQQVKVQLSTVLQAVVSQQLLPSEKTGLIPVFEIMKVNSAIRNMIRESKVPQIDTVLQTSKAEGMQTMDMSIAELCKKKLICTETALTYAVNKEVLKRYISTL